MANRTSGRFRAYALRLLTGSATVVLLVIAGCGQLAEKERELTFRVVPGTASWFDGLPQGVEETDLAIEANGKPQRIHAWWWPAAAQHAPAILYLHGSRWNLTGQTNRIEQLHAFGFSVLAIDYRGFGKSDGDLPSEETVYEDSRAAWDRLAQLQPDAQTCTYCDSAVVRDPAKLSMICPECFARNADHSRFCVACGIAFAFVRWRRWGEN